MLIKESHTFLSVLILIFIGQVSAIRNKTVKRENLKSTFINLTSDVRSSVCKYGLQENIDVCSFVGTVNAKDLDISSREAVQFYYVTPVYVELCTVHLHTTSCTLPPVNVSCYCFYRSAFVYKIMVQRPAVVALSCAKIYMYLPPSADRQQHYEIVQEYFPPIYGQEELSLTVNGRIVSMVGSSYSFVVVKYMETKIQWCVTNLHTHKLTINRDGLLLTSSGDECLNYSFVEGGRKLWYILKLQFNETEGCQRQQTYVCEIQVTQLILTWYGPIQSVTTCKNNLVQDADSITLQGTVIASEDEFKARPHLIFQREDMKNGIKYIDVCVVNLNYDKCTEGSEGHCFCLYRNNTLSIFVLNIPAKTSKSLTRYFLRWPFPANKTSDRSDPFTTPLILNKIEAFAKKDATLWLDNQVTNLTYCFLHLKEGVQYLFDFCVYSARDPILKISFDDTGGLQYRFDKPCGRKDVTIHSGHYQKRFSFSYSEGASGCGVQQTYWCEVLAYDVPTIRIGATLLAPDMHQCTFYLLPEVTYHIQWCVGYSLNNTMSIYHGSKHLVTAREECATYTLNVPYAEDGEEVHFKYFGILTGHSVKYSCHYTTSHVVLYNVTRTKSKTFCKDGLVEVVDRIFLKARLYATKDEIDYRPHLVFQTRPRSTLDAFVNMCIVNLSWNNCMPVSSERCYCQEMKDTYIGLFLNITAMTNLSSNDIRLQWLGTTSTQEVSDVKILPVIHRLAVIHTRQINLRVDGLLTNLEHCSLRLTPGIEYTFELCLFNSTDSLIYIDFGDLEERTVFESSCGSRIFHMTAPDYGRIFKMTVVDGVAGCKFNRTFVCKVIDLEHRARIMLQILIYTALGICLSVTALIAIYFMSKRDGTENDDFTFDVCRTKAGKVHVQHGLKIIESEV